MLNNIYSQFVYKRTNTSGKNSIAIISYFIFSYVGIAVISLGAMKLELASHFGIETSKLQYILTLFSAAITVSVVTNKFFLQKFSLKKNLIFSSFAVILGTLGLTSVQNIVLFSIYITLAGLGIGLYTSFANFMIVNLYDDNRSAKLVVLHACYSACAVLTPVLAAFLINRGFSWVVVCRAFLLIVCVSMLLIFKNDFSAISYEIESERKTQKFKINGLDKKVYLSSLAIFLYTFFEAIVNYWIVEYLVLSGVESQISKLGISSFWIFMVVGRVVIANIMRYIRLENYIKTSSILAGFSLLALLFTDSLYLSFLCIGLSGMFSAALYPSILSFGTQGKKTVDPSVMTTIILSGSFGVIFCSPVSGALNEKFGVTAPIVSGIIAIFLVFFVIGGASTKRSR